MYRKILRVDGYPVVAVASFLWLFAIGLGSCSNSPMHPVDSGGDSVGDQGTHLDDNRFFPDHNSDATGDSVDLQDLNVTEFLGSVRGRLASPKADPHEQKSAALSTNWPWYVLPLEQAWAALSLAEVSVDLLRVSQGTPPGEWAVEQTATPDPSGTFVFDGIPEGDYALRLNQPEFAAAAYGVDTTEFHLGAGQIVSLVLPVMTTLIHGLTAPVSPVATGLTNTPPAAATLDHSTGEVVIVSGLGVALVHPDQGTMDLLFSRNLFHGRAVIALSPETPVIWILYSGRLVRIDGTLFSDPAASEVFDLDDPATRLTVGDKVQTRLIPAPPGYGGCYFSGNSYFSPDEQFLYAPTQESGTMVIDLVQMKIVRVILGSVIGHNRQSNHLFLSSGQMPGSSNAGVLVVDASTQLEVNVVPMEKVLGVAAFPGQANTLLLDGHLSTSDQWIPFVKVVDEGGTVIVDQRARDYLGLDHDPVSGAPSFDVSGRYLMIGTAAFRILPEGAFEEVLGGIEPGHFFNQAMQNNRQRAVDPTNLYELWYGSWEPSASVGLISLDRTNVPVAFRPGVQVSEVLLDATRGRAMFPGSDRLVLVHYADATASQRDEVLDLRPVIEPFLQEGAPCSNANPCGGTDLCAGATDTASSGRCLPNPRLPYLPYCGGFTQRACDDGFTCQKLNPTNPNSMGWCVGRPNRDYDAHGPVCSVALPCPAGMACNQTGHCQPKPCLRDKDCAAWPGEICGQVDSIGRTCLPPGSLPDGAPCLRAEECLHGTCVAVLSAYTMGTADLLFGTFGLLVCTTPCYQGADCPDDVLCAYDGPPLAGPTYASGETIWQTHRNQVMPYCWPSVGLPPEGCDGTCSGTELCASAFMELGCQTGFEPIVYVDEGTPWCLPPAQDGGGVFPVVSAGCSFRCLRSGDCPFQVDCVGGTCRLGDSPCGMTCASDQSCAWLSLSPMNQIGLCTPDDACTSDADCLDVSESCQGSCIQTCNTNSDCAAGECVGSVNSAIMGVTTRYCLPTQCGCAGPFAGDMFCDVETDLCVLEGLCSHAPCDGLLVPECVPTPPDPLPTDCRCPGCDWNTAACSWMMGTPLQVCPEGFECSGMASPPLPSTFGRNCVCNSPECHLQ